MLLLLLSLFEGACSSKYPNGKVVVYTPFPELCANELAKVFEKKTGIYVEQVLEGTSHVLARLKAEKDNPRADVWYGAAGMIGFINAADEGLLDSYQPKGFENEPLKRGNLILRDKDFRWVGIAIIGLGYAYNPQKLTRQQIPQTWDELADPKWQGQIEMWDPASSGTSMLFLDATILRYKQHGKTEAEAWDYLKAVFHNLKRYTVEGKPAFNVARGETAIGLHFEHQVNEFMLEQSGGDPISEKDRNIRWYLPPESPVVVDPIALVKGARNPENARKFIDFVMSPEGQKIVNKLFYTVDPSLPPPPNMEGFTVDDMIERAMPLDPEWMAQNLVPITQKWEKEVEATAQDE